MKPIDDYELIEEDFDEFIRRGQEAFGLIERLKPKGESA